MSLPRGLTDDGMPYAPRKQFDDVSKYDRTKLKALEKDHYRILGWTSLILKERSIFSRRADGQLLERHGDPCSPKACYLRKTEMPYSPCCAQHAALPGDSTK